METLTTSIVKIGNSRGIRLPKFLIEQLGLGEQVEITVRRNHLVIRPLAPRPRADWDTHFREMAASVEDMLVDPPTPTQFDKLEWQW